MSVGEIPIREAYPMPDVQFVDTRSPAEFDHDAIPGAINLPLLDNEERKQVGITYKQDPQEAFDLGIEYYSQKLPRLVSEIRAMDTGKPIVVYCWRGGMRSKAIAQLFDLLGFRTYQLQGGYKRYRSYVQERLCEPIPFTFIVLDGLAGSGKTDIIHSLSDSVDLEGLAQHRSSLFGAIGLRPRSQKKFESLLLQRLDELRDNSYVFVEGESRKIGNIFIPEQVFRAMQQGIRVYVSSSMQRRCERIVRDYFTHGEDERIKEIIWSLRQSLTKKEAERLIQLVEAGSFEEVARRLLEDYYDPRYAHNLEQLRYDYRVDADDLEKCCQRLREIASSAH